MYAHSLSRARMGFCTEDGEIGDTLLVRKPVSQKAR